MKITNTYFFVFLLIFSGCAAPTLWDTPTLEGEVGSSRTVTGGAGIDSPSFAPWLILTPRSTPPTDNIEAGGIYLDDGTNCSGGTECLKVWTGSEWIEITGGGGSGDITAVGDVATGAAFTGADTGNTLYFEGSTDDTYETALTAADTTGSDKTITLPNETGMVLTSATAFAGDVTGTAGATVVGDDSHAHTSSSVTLSSTDLTDTADLLYETELDSEAELEAQLVGVTDVYTNNDGALSDDDVTLSDVQTALSNDFHNAGGTDAERTQEEIDDFVNALINDVDSVHTRITITYDDTDDAYDFVVDDMNDDQPDNDAEVPDNITVDPINATTEAAIEAVVDLQDLQGTVTDSQVPDDITITESDPNALLTAGTDNVKDTHIDWGSGAGQVNADDIGDGSTNAIPTLTQETNWDTTYGWGDHSTQNYLDLDTYPNADTDSTDDITSLAAGSAGIDVAGNSISLDIAPSSGSATLIEEEDALQVKYNATHLTEGVSGLDILSVAGITGADEDNVSLSDVQSALSNDFHNAGGTDDDVPEAGDFGAANDLDANGDVANDSHDHATTISGKAANVSDADFGDVIVSTGVWSLDTGSVDANELVSTAVTPGSYTNTDLTVDADGRITAASNGAGGGGTPGGADTQVQFNDGGSFGGDSGFVWDKTNDFFTVTGTSGKQARFAYDGSNYGDFQIDSAGDLYILPTGDQIFIGTQAGGSTQSGAVQNQCAGDLCLSQLTSGDSNTSFGWSSLSALLTGSANTCVGRYSCAALQSGSNNVAIGSGSLANALAVSHDFALGTNTFAAVTGNYNIGIGGNVATTMTSSAYGIYIGYSAAGGMTTHNETIAIGTDSMDTHSGQENTIVGSQAAKGSGTPGTFRDNTIIGRYAAGTIQGGSDYNTIIGAFTADNLAGGADYNVIIGANRDAQSTTASNQLDIGGLLFSNGIDATGTSVSTGGFGVGEVSPNITRLHVDGGITINEISSTPSSPNEGSGQLYQSDGTPTGSDGEWVITRTAGGSTYDTIIPFEEGSILTTASMLQLAAYSADPCSGLAEGAIFWNDTADVPCYCDASLVDLKFSDDSACF